MKRFFILMALCLSAAAFAHDEGHGPKLTDQPKQGGMVTAVIHSRDADKGAKAELVYKSELVRGEDGTISLYLYDKDMKQLPLSGFEKTAQAKIGPMKKNPKWKTESFTLEQRDGAFVGKSPKIKTKPFYIDVVVAEGSKKLLTAYDNLD